MVAAALLIAGTRPSQDHGKNRKAERQKRRPLPGKSSLHSLYAKLDYGVVWCRFLPPGPMQPSRPPLITRHKTEEDGRQ